MNKHIQDKLKEFDKKAKKYVGKKGLRWGQIDPMAIDLLATRVWFKKVLTDIYQKGYLQAQKDSVETDKHQKEMLSISTSPLQEDAVRGFVEWYYKGLTISNHFETKLEELAEQYLKGDKQ